MAVLHDELGLAPTQIAELLDIVADMLEQGEAARGSGHSENAVGGPPAGAESVNTDIPLSRRVS